MRRSRVRLLVAAPFAKIGRGNGRKVEKPEGALVLVTLNDPFMKGCWDENESNGKREYDAPLVGRLGVHRKVGCKKFGGVPERSKGSDCKSDGFAFEGSNPSPTTIFGEQFIGNWLLR